MTSPPHEPIQVVHRIERDRTAELHDLYVSTWWASERTADDIGRILDGSTVVVGLLDARHDRLIGFCRAISDGRILAVILDVIVHPDRRGEGLGVLLMEAMLARPELAGVDSVELVCQPDLVDFYRRFGFTDRVGTSLLMRRTSNPRLTG